MEGTEEVPVDLSGNLHRQRTPFVPREDLINTIVQLGFTRNAAIKGLYSTSNYSADLAATWIMDNQDQGDLDEEFTQTAEDSDESEDSLFPEGVDFYKMVFVVNNELSMGVGKIAAQVAHAALGLHRQLLELPHKYGQMLMSWEQFGETKIVLKGETTKQLLDLCEKCQSMGLPSYVVHDAGCTQVAEGSVTVLGIMGKIDAVDSVTGKLKLL